MMKDYIDLIVDGEYELIIDCGNDLVIIRFKG